MGVISQILIDLPKNGKHVTGQSIKGIVKYVLDEETEYKEISLSIIGKGYFTWFDPKRDRQTYTHHKREAHETIMVKKIDLLKKITDDSVIISAGAYEKPFEIIISEDTPPTVKTNLGELKYNLLLKFIKPKIFSINKEFSAIIEIYPSVDSYISDDPVIFELNKAIAKPSSSKTQEINIKAKLDKGYLTPSSKSKISFIVINNSDVTLSVKTELVCNKKYRDDYIDSMLEEEVIQDCTVISPSVLENRETNLLHVIPVPPELYTVRHSKRFTREYKLKVTMNLPLPHISESVEVPVFVGDRFRDENNEFVCDHESGAIGEPPSYWEAMSEDKLKSK